MRILGMKELHLIKQGAMDKIIILQKIVDKKMTQSEAEEIMNFSQRHIRRLVKQYRSKGAESFYYKENKVSNRKLSDVLQSQVLGLIKSKYVDFGPTLVSEKLDELDGLKISRETIRKWMISANIWRGKKRKKVKLYQSRERRPCFGELVQIDGSPHDWFEGRSPKCCLIVMIDDATSKITCARFTKAETTFSYMQCIEAYLQQHGRPIAYYSDRHSIFKTSRESEKDRIYQDTQLHRALKELNIKLICANSPQAKGRVERANQTLQDRLIKDMRLAGISDIESGNVFLESFITKYNNKFGVEPANPEDAHRVVTHNALELSFILSNREVRKLSKNLEFSLHNAKYQIQNAGKGYRMRQGAVTIYTTAHGEVKVLYEGKELEYKVIQTNTGPIIADFKEISEVMDNINNLHELPTNPHSHQQRCQLA